MPPLVTELGLGTFLAFMYLLRAAPVIPSFLATFSLV